MKTPEEVAEDIADEFLPVSKALYDEPDADVEEALREAGRPDELDVGIEALVMIAASASNLARKYQLIRERVFG